MSDYGHELEFGIFPTPDASRLGQVLELAQLAEVRGLDLVSVQDHPYQAKHVDAWTLLTVIGARTSAIKLSPDVASLPLRPPVVLAKAAATLDLVTAGRVELGLGAGAFWDAIAAAGGPRRTPKESVDSLIEAIRVIRAFWAGGSVTVEGDHYRVRGLHAGPVPAHDIPIWVGAYKPRMIRVTGELADAWVPSMGYADPPALADLSSRLDEAAVGAGRAPEQIRRIYNVFGRFGSGSGLLQGRPSDWAEQLARLTLDHGLSTYILGTDDADTVRRFADEVAPATRELVASARALPDHEPPAPAQPVTRERVELRPTPDRGERLTGELAWDESARPTLGAASSEGFPPVQAATAQHLVDVHDGLRAELAQVRDIVDQVRDGFLSVGQARSVINTMTIRQNNWTLGAYCESYCRIVATHHTLEDRQLFPHLRRSEPGLGAVLDRLEEEHEVIAEVLDELDRALVALVGGTGTGSAGEQALDALQAKVDLLTDSLLSHLSYEERELLGPLARNGLG